MERFLKPVFTEIITEENKNKENTSTFKIEKLERGFGQTMGTSMRRALLSSVPGAAAFAIELKGVTNEFQAIKDVKEDVVELILNIKDLVFKADMNIIDVDEIFEIRLVSKGKVVKAKDLDLPTGLEIVNKNLVIANTSKDKALDLKIFVTYSKGFKTFEDNRLFADEKLGTLNGIISIDSNYSPIQSVNYNVEEVNPGESKVYERLTLDVETKGNMEASEAVALAGAILKNHYIAFEELETLDQTKTDDMFEEEQVVEEDNMQLSITIEELNLSVRSQNGLEKADINTVGELINRPFSGLKEIENLGDKSVSEIVEAIQNLGLSFKTE